MTVGPMAQVDNSLRLAVHVAKLVAMGAYGEENKDNFPVEKKSGT